MFRDVCERAGLGRDWAAPDLRHTFVSLLSDDGMAIEKIARHVGHAGRLRWRTGCAISAPTLRRFFGWNRAHSRR